MAEVLANLGIKDLFMLGASLHDSVEDFVLAISSEYIDYSSEKKKEQLAAKAIKEWEQAYEKAESLLSTYENSKEINISQKLIGELKESTNADIISYHRGTLRLEQRKNQFFKCSPLTRSFVSPRVRRWDPWEDDSASPRSRELGTFYCVFIPFVVFALFGTGFILSSFHVGEKPGELRKIPSSLSGFRSRILPANISIQSLLSSTSFKERPPCSVDGEDQKMEL